MSNECTHPGLNGKSGGCDLCQKFVLVRRQVPVTIFPNHEQGDNTERLPNDAYAAQGGKAAVNELLTMKMRQVLKLNQKLDDIRDFCRDVLGKDLDESTPFDEGFSTGSQWAARQVETILNKLED